MKKFLVFLLTAAMIFSVIGCAQPAAEEAPAVEEAPVEEAVVEEAAPEAAPYVAVVSKGFQHKCIEAYGKASNGRDRDDRVWKEKKINNKFEELELPYKIDVNNLDKTYCLLKRKVT